MLFLPRRIQFALWSTALAGFFFGLSPIQTRAQAGDLQALESELKLVPLPDPSANALPLPEDRGAADLEQTLKRLGTTASVLAIVAHPDDEDGALLTYLSRGLGARVTLMTLTRGEGGQNAMSADSYDALGLIRTQELDEADEYYGVQELWGTEADFGFSKTQQESFAKWGHDRVLYDAVLAVRLVRPQVILSTFVGAVSDGHGQHQVSGEIAQEAFKAAADPKVFPEQFKLGVAPWQPLAVYSRAPFARIENGRMFDYATGKSEPARFHNYVTGEWIEGGLSADVTLPTGQWDPSLGRTYAQIARQGWGKQMSQYGGANPALSEPDETSYHLWAVAPSAKQLPNRMAEANTLFYNPQVNINTSIAGLAHLAKGDPPAWLTQGLSEIQAGLNSFEKECRGECGATGAHQLAPIYRQTLDLYTRVQASDLDAESKAGLELEMSAKIQQFQTALKDLLGLDMVAFVTGSSGAPGFAGRGASADETARSVYPGEDFGVRVHTFSATIDVHLVSTWVETQTGAPWGKSETNAQGGESTNTILHLHVPDDAQPTKPFFTRPNTEQPYYDIANEQWRERSFAPYPLTAWAEFAFDGVPIRIGQVVQTLAHVNGEGGVYEPLVITPAIGVRINSDARILPLDGSSLQVGVTVHAQRGAEGSVALKLPEGWRSDPAQRTFQLKAAGDTEPLQFSVAPSGDVKARAYSIEAVAQSGGGGYSSGWQSVGYPGLPSTYQYLPAELKTRKVDVKIAPGLRVAYVMGTGDTVPDAIEAMGIQPHILSSEDLASGDLSHWNVIVIGIRAYSALPQLAAAQPRLDAFVENGGTLIVQYQGATFPAPLPITLGRTPERVVDEQSQVEILDPSNPLLNSPNKITAADFDGWLEERGHGFPDRWDAGYTALTQTADPGQDPQKGGLLLLHRGKGTYIYVAYALYRQLPELVPGAYRILANLLSAGVESTGSIKPVSSDP
jgi:LmbE family N-acetylglucosaminyl deacetylase